MSVSRWRCLSAGTGAADLLVLLPGAGMAPEAFVEAGCFDAVQARALALDLCAVAIGMAEVADGSAVDALKEQVLLPARQTHQRVWLGGISLGGQLALQVAAAHPALVDGLCLIAPYPGGRLLSNAIARAGGLDAWQPDATALKDPEARAWQWLKAPPPALPVFIGHGLQDRFADGMAQIADRFPSADRHAVEGGHDWAAWRPLWDRFLAAGHFPVLAENTPWSALA